MTFMYYCGNFVVIHTLSCPCAPFAGFDASSIVSHLSIILQMHKSQGKVVSGLVEDRHRESLRQLASLVASSPPTSAALRLLFDSLRRIVMYWGLVKDVPQLSGGKKKNKKKKRKMSVGGDVVEMQTDEPATEVNEAVGTLKLEVPAGAQSKETVAAGGRKRKRQKKAPKGESSADD